MNRVFSNWRFKSKKFFSSIRNRLILISVMLAIIIFPVMGMISYNISYSIISDILVRMNTQTVNDTCENISLVMENIRNIAENIAYDENLRRVLSEDYAGKSGGEKIKIYSSMDSMVSNVNDFTAGIASVNITGLNGFTYSSTSKNNVNLIDFNGFTSSQFYSEQIRNNKDYVFFLSGEFHGDTLTDRITAVHGNSIFISYLIKDENNNNLGTVIIIVDSSYLKSSILSENVPGSDYYIVNQRTVWEGGQPGEHLEYIEPEDIYLNEKNGYYRLQSSNGEAIVTYNAIRDSRWKFVKVSSVSAFTKDLEKVKKATLWMVSISVLVAVSLALVMSNMVSGSIKGLVKVFRWEGDFNGLNLYEESSAGKFNGLFTRLKFQNKLIVLFSTIIVVPAIALTGITVYITSNIIKEVDVALWQNAFSQTVRKCDFDLMLKRNLMQEIFRSERMQVIMKDINSRGKGFEKYGSEISNVLYKSNFSKYGILYINIYDTHGNAVYSTLSKSKSSYIDYSHKVTLKNLLSDSDGSVRWLGTYADLYNTYVFAAARELKDFSTVDGGNFQNLGYILIAFNETLLEGYYRNISSFPGADILLINGEGDILSSNDKSQISKKVSTYSFKLPRETAGNYMVTRDGRQKLVIFDSSLQSDWKIIGRLPIEEVLKSARLIVQYNVIILLAGIVVFITLAYSLSRQISSPLKRLMRNIAELEKGNMNITFHPRGQDEFSELARSFNSMVLKLRELIEEVYEAKISRQETEIRWKEAELNALQAQINPHFLYNTLDAIRCRAMFLTDGENEVSDMIMNLADLFRLSIRKGRDVVTISDEIEHVKCYLTIEEYRFGDKIRVEWELEESALQLKTVKLVLQPIVENAIYHGLEAKKGNGRIKIKIYRESEQVVFLILDDGVGMREEELEQVMHGIRPGGESRSVGLANVNQRVKLHFGDAYGISIISMFGEGTTVRVTIPVLQ